MLKLYDPLPTIQAMFTLKLSRNNILSLHLARTQQYIFFCLLLLSHQSLSASTTKISVYTQDFFPLSYTANIDGADRVVGYATQIVEALFEEAGLDCTINIVPWSRAIQILGEQENTVVYSLSRNSVRENKYNWIGKVSSVNINLYGLKENKDSLPKTLEEAKSYTVASVRSGAVLEYLQQEGFKDLKLINNIDRFMQLSIRKRFDLFPFADFAFAESARKLNIDHNLFIKAVGLNTLKTDLYIAASKQTNEAIITKLQVAYKKLEENGYIEKVINSMIR